VSLDTQGSPRRDGSSDPAAVDLFLSYNSRDRAAVQQVRTLLGARGVSVFYDRESLDLGRDWFEALEKALGQVRGVVVFLGPNGLGVWERRERALALVRQTSEPTFPVIPVLLPGSQAGDYTGFLLLSTYADLRGGLDAPDTLDAIMRAVRDPATGEEARRISPPEAAAICPYRGLNAFREEDAPLFFGRDRVVDKPEQGLMHKVLTCPLVAVVGASGSGKSSVVRAGLLPRLRREPPSRGTWDAVTFLPDENPFLSLAMALEDVRNPEASHAVREKEAIDLSERWPSANGPLKLSLGRAREALRVDRLLVVVDQFEELLNKTPKEDSLRFLSRLLAVTGAGSKITVLLTLRADYYGRAIGLDRGLCDGIQRGLVNVGAMMRDELRSAIEGPARRVGLEFEHGLVDRLLDDVGDEPGNLPLLEFGLTELWERREVRRLPNAAYEALGRVAGAIGRRAEAEFVKLTKEQKAAAKRLFGRLVRVTDVDEEGRDTRQRVRLGDLDEASRSAIEPFVAGRLLITARDPVPSIAKPNPDDGPAPSAPDDPTTVEVAHEALIRKWDRLQGWVKEDRAFLLWRQRLGFHIAEWERSGCDEGMLPRGALLKEAEDFNSRWDDLNERERVFLTWMQTDDYQIKRIEKEGLILVRFCDNPDTRSCWLRALALTRGVNEVIPNVSVIEDPGKRSEALRSVAGALAQAGLADQAKDAALQAKDAALRSEDPSDRSQALRSVAGALAQAGLADQAKDAALRIEDPSDRSQALCSVAAVLAQAGLADQAKDAALQAKDAALRIEEPWYRSEALCSVAAVLAQAGLADQAKDAALQAKDAALRIEKPWFRSEALSSVAEVLAQAGLADQAKDAALRIEDPSDRSQALCSVAEVLAQAGLADQAKDAALQAKDAALRIEKPWFRSEALSSVAEVLAQAGLADQAKDAALRIEDPSDRSQALCSVAEVLAQAGLADQAKDAALQAKDAALRIEDPSDRSQALCSVAGALAQAGLADQAKDAALQAKDAALRIEEPWFRSQALRSVAGALAQAGLADQAKDAALQAKDAALRSEGPLGIEGPLDYGSEALCSVAEVLVQAGLADQAKDAVLRIYPWSRSKALRSVATVLAQAGLADQAKDAALQAKDAALRIEEPWSRSEALCSVAEVLVQAGLADQAKDAALQAKDAALRSEEPRPRNRPKALRSVVEVLLSIGLIDDSREVASTIIDTELYPQLRSGAFASVAGAMARAHKFQLARDVAESCGRPEIKLDAFTMILIEYTKMTKPELAKILDELVKSLKSRVKQTEE